MRRVLFLSQRYPPDLGGLAVSAGRTAQNLTAAGAQVDVVAWTRTLAPGQVQTTGDNPVVHHVGLYHNQDLTLQHTTNVLEWLHEQKGFDAVWGHYLFPPGFLAVLFAERMGLPSIVSARGNDVDRMVYPPGDFARLEWTLSRATFITAVSDDLAHKIDVLLNRDSAAATCLPNVVDSEVFAPTGSPPDRELRDALGVDPDEAVLGFSGELRHKKGLPFLLRALTVVRQQRPACLLVVGEVRAREQEHLARYATDFPEDRARILVTGHLDNPGDVARHLCACDVFLMPSLWDGMPNAVLEAMACGLPVLASDAGGIPEIIDHDDSGLLIPRAHLDQLGRGILEILAHPDKAASLGARARERVVDRFQSAREVSALRALLDRVAGSSSSKRR